VIDGALFHTAIASGTLRFGDVDFAVHVLGDERRVVEVTDIETILGLPPSGLGSFLATLPGSDRVRFRVPGAATWRVGMLAEKVSDLLIAFWRSNNGTPAGAKAGRIVLDAVRRGMRKSGRDPEAAEWLMAAAMPPKEGR
jgi:hypothetical protein